MKKTTAFRHLTAGMPLAAALLLMSLSTSVPAAETKPAKPSVAPGELSLFDGKTLRGWKVADFAGHGEVSVTNNQIIIGQGVMTGIAYTNNDLPKVDYEVSLQAQRVEGSDFFCALTFPVKEDVCTLVVGGWGGGLVGISSLDGMDASENETTTFTDFKNGRWYEIRVCVRPDRIRAWIDGESVVNVSIEDRKVHMRFGEIEMSGPLGLATWRTTGAFRNIRLRPLPPEPK